jgi:hypothetical protein
MMKGRALLPVAQSLARAGAGEPYARSSVNRSYYAAFGEASDYVQGRGFVTGSGPGSHKQVWNYLDNGIPDGNAARQKERRALASQGLLLKDRREKADYRRHQAIGRDEPRLAEKEARNLIDRLDRLGV